MKKSIKKKLTKKQINFIIKKAELYNKKTATTTVDFISKHGVNQLEYWG